MQIRNDNYYNVTTGKATNTSSSSYKGDTVLQTNLLNKTFLHENEISIYLNAHTPADIRILDVIYVYSKICFPQGQDFCI